MADPKGAEAATPADGAKVDARNTINMAPHLWINGPDPVYRSEDLFHKIFL
jgi:hypothetical protein